MNGILAEACMQNMYIEHICFTNKYCFIPTELAKIVIIFVVFLDGTAGTFYSIYTIDTTIFFSFKYILCEGRFYARTLLQGYNLFFPLDLG